MTDNKYAVDIREAKRQEAEQAAKDKAAADEAAKVAEQEKAGK